MLATNLCKYVMVLGFNIECNFADPFEFIIFLIWSYMNHAVIVFASNITNAQSSKHTHKA